MATNDPLPAKDHVVRACARGVDNGVITSAAFQMKARERELLRISVDWVECPHAAECQRNIDGSVNRLKNTPVNPPFATLAVADIRKVKRESWKLDAREFGSNSNPCHSGITGFSGNGLIDMELQEELADIANQSPISW